MYNDKSGVVFTVFLVSTYITYGQSKAFPEESPNYEDKRGYHYNKYARTQFKPFYGQLNKEKPIPKTKLYYSPEIDGQPIFVPAIRDSANHLNEFLNHYYKKNKENTQAWTLATPVTYSYDDNSDSNYDEHPVTSNSIIKSIIDETYKNEGHRGNYVLPVNRGSRQKYHGMNPTTEPNEIFEHEDKSNKKFRPKIKKENVDSFGIWKEKSVNVQNGVQSKVPGEDYFLEAADAVNTKNLPDDDYAPEVVDTVNIQNIPDDDYAPEVVDTVNIQNIPDDDYAPEVVDTVNIQNIPDDDYAPEVVDTVNIQNIPDDDYAPEVVDTVNIQNIPNDDYAPEVVDTVRNIKHGNKNVFLPQTESVFENVDDQNYDEPIVLGNFAKDKVKDKKREKKPSSSSNHADDSQVVKSTSEKPNKPKRKKQSESVKKSETSSEYFIPTADIKKTPNSETVDKNLDEFYKREKIESSMNLDVRDKAKETSKKIKVKSTTESDSEHGDYIRENTRKIKKENILMDNTESHLGEVEKSAHASAIYESLKDVSGKKFLQDEATEKLKDMESVLDSNKPFNNPEESEKETFENQGSGELANEENIRTIPHFIQNVDFLRSLSSINSNIWPLIFNPNAERNELKKCVTRSNETGYCMYIQQCEVPNIAASFEELLSNACVMEEIFIGICCPEFPVETVKVNWEHSFSDSDKQTEDEFSHNAEDCGIRSNEASKARSWPWKARLVSMSNGKIFCGGVIISEDYILTAAHCTTKIPKNQILVSLGEHDDVSGEDFAVVEIKRHAQYNTRTMHNDIALLKLGKRAIHDTYTSAICLPDDDRDDHDDEKATLLGWKRISGKAPKKAEFLKVITNKECEKRLGTNIPGTLLCTEARNEDERTCNADSGAPLIIKDDGNYEVIGILSWNRIDCDQRFPSTFSRVSSYVRWIKKHAV